MRSRVWLLLAAVVLAVLVIALVEYNASTGAPPSAASMSGAYSVAQLPPEARATLALIDKGGPYPYRQDDAVFGNREHLLPAEPAGYYHEFTVVTPGSGDRGPRRLIRGQRGETYYTSDHYASFHLVERN